MEILIKIMISKKIKVRKQKLSKKMQIEHQSLLR